MALDVTNARLPAPLREEPPADRFCDLVLNGGVASGVVYPWALLHLARHYRFKSIGGNSVGAMAATLAAAAEYGRCQGVEDPFEPLRRLPLKLADTDDRGRTKMLRLFQPSPPVQRLFDLFIKSVAGNNPPRETDDKKEGLGRKPEPRPNPRGSRGPIHLALQIYGFWRMVAHLSLLLLVLLSLLVFATAVIMPDAPAPALGPLRLVAVMSVVLLSLLVLSTAVLLAGLLVAYRFYGDLHAFADNGYGLCSGQGQTAGEEGLVEWLHKGIQLSAGRGREDPPLTFADLWSAPRFGRAGPAPTAGGLQPDEPGIELQMFSSNVTQGRPIRLPLNDANTRLYFDSAEWAQYFTPTVLEALVRASTPYTPMSPSDPDPAKAEPAQRELMERLLELPSGGMPIVVAARLSLCFPALFSCVSVYAVDYEAKQGQRGLRKCLLSDGGLCTNFPIHLFDAAQPEWPTFAFLFEKRLSHYSEQSVWLPPHHLSGRSDNWQRGVPGAEEESAPERSVAMRLLGLAGGLLLTMKDWNDRVSSRLPHVRNRVIRLALNKGEGQLNLAMSSETILRMAHEYGTVAGTELVTRFGPDAKGAPGQAWREHLYVRSMIELRALRRHLKGYARVVRSGGDTVPLRELLRQGVSKPPLTGDSPLADPAGEYLTESQRQALARAVAAVEALEAELAACEAGFGPYRPVLEPELHLRPPI